MVGAGLAGLHTATLLARRGHDVLLAERPTTLSGVVRTAGIFVRKTLDDFPLSPQPLGPSIRRVVLHPPGLSRPVDLTSGRDEYRVGDMAPLYEAAAAGADDARSAGAHVPHRAPAGPGPRRALRGRPSGPRHAGAPAAPSASRRPPRGTRSGPSPSTRRAYRVPMAP